MKPFEYIIGVLAVVFLTLLVLISFVTAPWETPCRTACAAALPNATGAVAIQVLFPPHATHCVCRLTLEVALPEPAP